MKALISAGGKATRLRPITTTINKHLIPLALKPMIFFAIEKLVEAGVTEIGISVNPGDKSIAAAVGDGSRWGAKITCIEQRGGALGVAHVVANAEEFLGDEPFVFYLGDNIILGSIRRFVERFEKDDLDCLLALARVKDPERFGVPVIENGRIVRIDEKPAHPASNLVQTGIYVYTKSFFEAFKNIQPSARGEYEISDVNTWLVQNGRKVGFEEITGWWKDTGKPEDLLEGNQLLLNETLASGGKIEGELDPSVKIEGLVFVGKGSWLGAGVVLRGPVAIGENCVIENSLVGPNASIGNGVKITDTEIEHTIVFAGVEISCGQRIVDSLIGANARIVAANPTRPLGHKMVVGDNSLVEI